MKKILLLLLILFFGTSAYSQVKFGVKAGLNVSNVKFSSPSSYRSRVGYHGGVLLELNLGKVMLFRPELTYSLKGFAFPPAGSSGGGTLGLNYVNIPILLGVKPIKQLSILLGPEIGYLFKANSNFDKVKHDVSKNFNTIDYGLAFGVCYYVIPGMAVEARYTYGFKTLIDAVYTDSMGNATVMERDGANRVWQVSLNYFLLKGK